MVRVYCDSVAAPETRHAIPHREEFEANEKTLAETFKCGVLLWKEVPVSEGIRVGFGYSRVASPWRERVGDFVLTLPALTELF